MVIRRILPVVALSLLLCACGPRSYTAAGIQKALEKARPGDTLIIRNGEYSDLRLEWKASATSENPVVVAAQTPGGVRLSGRTSLHISGSGLEVRGLLLQGCVADKGTLVEFRNGDDLATGCRLTECVIDACNPARRDVNYSYVHLYGRGNRVDHCSFTGKLNLGVTLIVMLSYPDCDENYHSVDHNYFGPRPVYGSNGAETIRVGTSQQCMQNSRSQITDNLFDRCNGEVEVVSIKSCENTIARNVFYECQGVLALRHGDRNVAEGNLFIGHGVRNTGGLRIVGEDQVVRGNTMLGLAGERFFSALALMYGVPNSLPNRYMQVQRTIVEDNVFEACRSIDFTAGKDFERTLPPAGTVWTNNRVEAVQTTAEPSFGSLAEGRGASWFTPESSNRQEVEEIVLKDSLIVLEEGMRITRPTLIRAAEGVSPVVVFAGRKSQNMITICDGGSLTVRGIRFDGRLAPGRSLAAGISGDAINYAAETEDKGRYNADDMIIEDCCFERILGIPVNIYRGGSDESTAGPYVSISGCEFNDSCNKVRGSVIRITGAQILSITGCRFISSGRGGYSIRLDDAPWEKITLAGNSFTDSGKILSNR